MGPLVVSLFVFRQMTRPMMHSTEKGPIESGSWKIKVHCCKFMTYTYSIFAPAHLHVKHSHRARMICVQSIIGSLWHEGKALSPRKRTRAELCSPPGRPKQTSTADIFVLTHRRSVVKLFSCFGCLYGALGEESGCFGCWRSESCGVEGVCVWGGIDGWMEGCGSWDHSALGAVNTRK